MELKRVQEIYKQMEGLVIELDPNPAARGPQYLQDLISKTRGFLNTSAFFLQQVMRERHASEMDLESAEADFQVQSDELLANDRRVSLLPNIDDRKAMINVLLSEQRRTIQGLKRDVKNLGLVEKAIRFRHKELEQTMSAIRLQRSLIETELKTGAVYGDENDVARGWGRGTIPVQDAIDDMDETALQALWDTELQNVGGAEEEASEDDEEATEEGTDEEESDVEESGDDEEGASEEDEQQPEAAEPQPEPEASEKPTEAVKEASVLDGLDLGGDDVDLEDEPPPKKARKKRAKKEKEEPAPQPEPQPEPVAAASEPQPEPEEDEEEDPDIEKFLDGDDFSDLFDDL